MRQQIEDQFETLEGAHDFVTLLAETVAEAKRELESDVERESASNVSRRLDALRIALYDVCKLEDHVNRTSRILNDLRMLRRILLDERGKASATQSAKLEQGRAVQLPPNSLLVDTRFVVAIRKSLAA